ncbi:MAG: hypothetical protein NWF00_04030 [Candidatus Bathyarchaeota archaeon]|nr:hypothetical protein [Candidatus Bathyarchaeota archaeon]
MKAVIVVLLVYVMFIALLTSTVVYANSFPQPSVPEFTLMFVDNSYDVPTTFSIDPYTGQNITHQGYHVSRVNLMMVIQNQPLVYQNNGSFFYNINVKGNYDENWTQFYTNDDIPLANASSAQTSIILGVLDISDLTLDSGSKELIVPVGGKADFQVQAMIGGFHRKAIVFSGWFFQGELSSWSKTQTITVPEKFSSEPVLSTSSPSQTSISPTLTPSPSVPEFQKAIIVTFLMIAITITAAAYKTGVHSKGKSNNNA